MIPVYFYSSSSNLTRRFAEHLQQRGRTILDLSDKDTRSSTAPGKWVLLTPSYKAGNDDNDTLPKPVLTFLSSPTNRRRLVGIIGTGNRNFGAHYQAAARKLSRASGRPILHELELSGTPEDVDACVTVLSALDAALSNEHP